MKILISLLVFAISFNKQCVSNILNKTKVFFGVDCPDFGKIENGVATKIDTMNIQALHIECNPGFELIGRPKVLCDAGHWENIPRPQCAKRCPPPPFLRNAEVRIEGRNEENEKYRKGSLATYTCGDGFRLFPTTSKYRHCKDGIWTGMQGTCVAYGCQHPASISNGYYVMEGMQNNQADNSANGINVGQRAHYNCNLGYMLNGSATVQCIDSGDWSPRISPQCNKILPDEGGLALPCAMLPSAAHTTATTLLGLRTADDRAIQGTELELRCEEGYRDPRDACPPSRRPNILRCVGGTWEGQVPNCVSVEGCIAPANISDGMVHNLPSDGRYKVHHPVWYSCLTQGYELYGNPYLSCTMEGCWEPSVLPECRQDPQDNSSRLSALANGSLVVSLTTALIVTVLVLGLCAVFGWRRHSCRSHRHRAPRPRPTVGPASSAPIADGAAGVSLLHDPDRVALIAFADGVQRGEVIVKHSTFALDIFPLNGGFQRVLCRGTAFLLTMIHSLLYIAVLI